MGFGELGVDGLCLPAISIMKAMKHEDMSKDSGLSGENRRMNGDDGPYKGPGVQMVFPDVLPS
jgi:hypothetical protein